MATIQKNLRPEFAGEKTPELPKTATVTGPLPDETVREEIRRVVEHAGDLAEDLVIAVEVRKRIADDTGERLTLTELIEAQGFDPADFGVE